MSDMVNSPEHYTQGRKEVIECIEDWTKDAPDGATGYCHGNAIKYIARLWHKDNPEQDIDKCIWYLERLKENLGVVHEKEHAKSMSERLSPLSKEARGREMELALKNAELAVEGFKSSVELAMEKVETPLRDWGAMKLKGPHK